MCCSVNGRHDVVLAFMRCVDGHFSAVYFSKGCVGFERAMLIHFGVYFRGLSSLNAVYLCSYPIKTLFDDLPPSELILARGYKW